MTKPKLDKILKSCDSFLYHEIVCGIEINSVRLFIDARYYEVTTFQNYSFSIVQRFNDVQKSNV